MLLSRGRAVAVHVRVDQPRGKSTVPQHAFPAPKEHFKRKRGRLRAGSVALDPTRIRQAR